MIKTKICSKCNQKKFFDDFHKDNKGFGGVKSSCKDCVCLLRKTRYDDTRANIVSVARSILSKSKDRAKKRYIKQMKRQNKLVETSDVIITTQMFNLDLEWVFNQRDKQNNKCYYTNIDMVWSIGYIDETKRVSPFAVSIERKNSSLGYTKDNCVLSSWWANCSKGAGTFAELVYFSSCVINKYIYGNVIDNNFMTLHNIQVHDKPLLTVKDNLDYKLYKEEKEGKYYNRLSDKKIIDVVNKKNYSNAARDLGTSATTLRRYIESNNLLQFINKKLPRNKQSKINWPNDKDLAHEIELNGYSSVSFKLGTNKKILQQRLKRKNIKIKNK